VNFSYIRGNVVNYSIDLSTERLESHLLLIMNDLNLLNCTEIFFHESGYFIVKVSIIQNNLDENNLPFLPFILKRFTLFFQEINNQLIHTAMVNHSNFDIALSISNYLTSLMITTPC
jgi:hypothetical protein